MDKPGSTDSSDISICEVVQLEDEGGCIEIKRDRWIAMESQECPQHTRGRQVTGTLLVNQFQSKYEGLTRWDLNLHRDSTREGHAS